MGALRRYSDCQAEVARKLIASLPPAENGIPSRYHRVGAPVKPSDTTNREPSSARSAAENGTNRRSPSPFAESASGGRSVGSSPVTSTAKQRSATSKGGASAADDASVPRKGHQQPPNARPPKGGWSNGANPAMPAVCGDLYGGDEWSNDAQISETQLHESQARLIDSSGGSPQPLAVSPAHPPRGGASPVATPSAMRPPRISPQSTAVASDARATRRRSFDAQSDRLRVSNHATMINGGGGGPTTGFTAAPVLAAQCEDLYGNEDGDHVPITCDDDDDVNRASSGGEAPDGRSPSRPVVGTTAGGATVAAAARVFPGRPAPRAPRAQQTAETAWLPPRAATRIAQVAEDGESGDSDNGGMVVRRHTVGTLRERHAASAGRARAAMGGNSAGAIDAAASASTANNAMLSSYKASGGEGEEDDGEEGEWSSPERTLRRSCTADNAARRRPPCDKREIILSPPPAGSPPVGGAHVRTGSAGSVGHGGGLEWDVEGGCAQQQLQQPQQHRRGQSGEEEQDWKHRHPPQCVKAAMRARVVGRLSAGSGAGGGGAGPKQFVQMGTPLPPHLPPHWGGPSPPTASATTNFIPPHLVPCRPSASSARSISAPPARVLAPPSALGPSIQGEEDAQQQLPPPPRLLRTLSSLSSSSARSSCSHISTSSAPAGPIAPPALRARNNAETGGRKQSRRGVGTQKAAGGGGEGGSAGAYRVMGTGSGAGEGKGWGKESIGKGKAGGGAVRGRVAERVAVGTDVQRVYSK